VGWFRGRVDDAGRGAGWMCDWGRFWCGGGFGARWVREGRVWRQRGNIMKRGGEGCRSPKTTVIYAYVSNKNVSKIKSPLDNLPIEGGEA